MPTSHRFSNCQISNTTRLPLRRQYRKQVSELAQTSAVFAKVAAEYEAFDTWRSSQRH